MPTPPAATISAHTHADSAPPRLILGSTSAYRRELLTRLRLPFTVARPEVDETPLPEETPALLAQRLALAKARAVAQLQADADVVVIGADQVADLAGHALGKPHTHERAVAQLSAMRGRTVIFQTAVAVVRPKWALEACTLVPVVVKFRTLSDAQIEHYLRAETPYDCAGSAKAEGLGIALLSALESSDPTAIIGLPLIATCELLCAAGLDPLIPLAHHLTA